MVYLFAIFFSIFILILNLFGDLVYLLIVYLFLLIWCLFLKIRIEYILVLILSAILAVIVEIYHNYNYFDNCKMNSNIFVGTWYFSDKIVGNKYVFVSSSWKSFYVKFKKNLQLWKEYLVVGYINNVKFETGFKAVKKYFQNTWYRFYRYILMKGYCWKLKVSNMLELTWHYHYSFFEKVKNYVKKRIVDLYGTGQNWSLLLGMLLGDKSFMNNRQYRQYIDSQIVHIVAVSWWNLALVWFLLGLVLFWVPFYIRLFLIFVWITSFVFIVWNDSSIIRAWIMASFMMLALFFWRSILVWRLLSITVILMLMYNPYFLPYDLWFLLSFGAFVGIVILNEVLDKARIKYEILYDKLRKRFTWRIIYKLVREYIFPTIWATIGILPILIFFIWKINLLWILANFSIVFIVPLVTLLGVFSLILSNNFVIQIENYLLSYINLIATLFSNNQICIQVNNWLLKTLIFVVTYFALGYVYFYFTKKFLNHNE